MKGSNKQAIKTMLNIMLIVGTFIIVIYFALASGDIKQIVNALRGIHKGWLLGAIGCFMLYAFFEGFITYAFFRFQKVKTMLSSNITVGLVGMYYSSITPAATGGQPIQVYSLRKRGVSTGVSSSALAVKFFCWQCAVLIIGIFLWATHTDLVKANMHGGIVFLVIGFIVNAAMVVIVLLLAISRNIVRAIVIFAVNIGAKLRIVKDKAMTASKADAALEDFHASVNLLTKEPFQFIVLFLLSVCEVLALMSAIYFVYRGLGMRTHHYSDLLTMQTMLHIAASFTPLPGASGAQEGGFYLFFGSFFPDNIIFAAMFVWRFVTYYLSIICGFIAVLIDNASRKNQSIRS
ncbi:MAG: lysylphosphatidylglycerol synthase transmembrane domain-containing protein [Eubacteriales bacterium]|nr:lysylphosphatidylglycerol synthase transmembrane domain-containing protein [Eubacteriales bacterium]